VVLHHEACFFCGLVLALLDGFVHKLEHFAALDTDHVVMMTGIIEFENRAAPFEIVSDDEAG
jgi:hypothetical protein